MIRQLRQLLVHASLLRPLSDAASHQADRMSRSIHASSSSSAAVAVDVIDSLNTEAADT